MRIFIVVILIIAFYLSSCKYNTSVQSELQVNHFKFFEMTFSNAWSYKFSIILDSSKIFIASTKKWDTIQFGMLSNSIFRLIDSTLSTIKKDSTIKSNDAFCEDCSSISIKAIFKNDTMRIIQGGDKIDKIFHPIVDSLEFFLFDIQHTKTSIYRWGTERVSLPPPFFPPPPRIDIRKFKPPHIK